MTDPVTVAATGSVLNTIIDLGASVGTAKRHMKPSSLTDVTQVARVEPLTIIDSDCAYLDYLPDVLQSLNSQFCGYYLQAASLLADISNVKVARMLDRLNPNRNPDTAAFIGEFHKAYSKESIKEELGDSFRWKLAQESYKWRLPTEYNTVAMEAEIDRTKPKNSFAPSDSKTLLSLNEATNLSVGKLINVTLTSNGQSMTLPIAVRLIVSEMPKSSLLSLFSASGENNGFVERYYKWKAGRINFVSDLILCQDLIKKHKKDLMNDKEGVLSEIMRRNKNHVLSGFMSKNPSVASASNLFVISKETADQLASQYDIRMDDFKSRQRMFDSSYAMIVVVIDREWERVNFYHNGVRMPTSLGLRDIRMSNKSGGPDIADILNAYKKGEAPSL